MFFNPSFPQNNYAKVLLLGFAKLLFLHNYFAEKIVQIIIITIKCFFKTHNFQQKFYC